MTSGPLPPAAELCTVVGVFDTPSQCRTRFWFHGLLVAVIASVLIPVMLDPAYRLLARASVVMYALSGCYGVLMLYGVGWVKRVLPQAWAGLFFGAMIGLFTLFYVWAVPSYNVWVLAMPVVSMAVATVRLRWAVAVAIGFLAAQALFLAVHSVEWRAISTSTIALSVGMVFTIVCTELALWANASRERAEQLTRELEAANAELRTAAERTAALAAATERNRIARDIHDGLGHYLTVVAVQLQAARALAPAPAGRLGEALEKAERSARAALDDVRRSVGTLRETAGRPPLGTALDGLVRESGLTATFACLGAPRVLSEAAEQALFRVAQEGLTNVRKHAGPARVAVRLDYRDGSRVSVEVADDGRGAPAVPGEGFGLAGLRERLTAVGGTLQAGNGAGGGFQVRAEVAV